MTSNTHAKRRSALHEVAASQDGYFSVAQAQAAGYSSQLIRHHCNGGRFQRVRRGIYRLSDYPRGKREDLMVLWLWSDQLGVFSHSTALSLHGLSDLLPERVHLTLPDAQHGRRREVPGGVILHFAEVGDADRTWYGSVPVTSPRRTLLDCVAYALSPEVLEQALEQAVRRGLLDVGSITQIAKGIEELEAS